MKAGITISATAHAAALLWGLISFGPRPFESPPESLPVDIVSATEFSQLMAGAKNAPQAPAPKPVVDKVGERQPVADATPKVSDKQEIVTAAAPPPMPTPAPKVPDPKPVPVPAETRPEPTPKDANKRPPDPKTDPIADMLKKQDHKKAPDAKKQDVKAPTPPTKQPPPAPKFDPTQISALLDKRAPQRRAATGEVPNATPTLGALDGRSATLSQTEIDALRAQIQACWSPPAGAVDGKELVVQVKILLKQDGSLQAEPVLLNHGANPFFQVAAESALRAVRRCQPYKLPIAKYEAWKDVEVTFDPREMFRG